MNQTSLLTFAEFEQLPSDPGKQELIDGEVISVPPPKYRQRVISTRIFDLLRAGLPPARVWHETGYRIGPHYLQPDVSVTWPDQQVDEYLIGPPMLAIEVLSRGNTAAQIDRKLGIYLSSGAAEIWVVNDRHQTMSVHRAGGGETVSRIGVSDTYSSPVVPVTLDLTALFS